MPQPSIITSVVYMLCKCACMRVTVENATQKFLISNFQPWLSFAMFIIAAVLLPQDIFEKFCWQNLTFWGNPISQVSWECLGAVFACLLKVKIYEDVTASRWSLYPAHSDGTQIVDLSRWLIYWIKYVLRMCMYIESKSVFGIFKSFLRSFTNWEYFLCTVSSFSLKKRAKKYSSL